MTNPFYRLAPYIQEFIYRNHWNELRDVQTQAISAILDSDEHVLIAAGTSSGKTEAAFFPILSQLYKHPSKSFGAVYIGPLKALINDQFERIEELLKEADVPVFAWHGDRSASEKERAVKLHRGILQITPESLEALLMNRSGELKQMFSDLKFVVIDEVHAFQGQDRGLQLLCQLARIEQLIGCSPRRVGLSATIHDYEGATKWLGAGTTRQVRVVESREGGRKLNLAMECFAFSDKMPPEETEALDKAYYTYLYRQVRGKKCIIFTNNRSQSEETIEKLRADAREAGEPDVFYVHHGSLSKAIRSETEMALKNAQGPAIAAATRTLELGIDLGGLERVVQLGAPFTCSSFVQRLGRSGRRGTPAEMRYVVRGVMEGDNPFDLILWDLIQNIAITQLYLEERWVETPREKPCPYSVLLHQTLSILSQSALKPPELARRVLTLPGLRSVPLEDFRKLLRHALETDLIQKTEDGDLIVGLAGETLTNSYRFYSVFQDDSGYKVFSRERELGEIDELPNIDDILMLAGRKWRVVDVDPKRGCAYVEPTKARKVTRWSGGGGEIDDKIVQRMKKVLEEDFEYGYLQKGALKHLQEAREIARRAGILSSAISGEGGHLMMHPWLGTRKLKTLAILLNTAFKEPLGVFLVDQRWLYLDLQRNPSAGDFLAKLSELLMDVDEGDIILDDIPSPKLAIDRYDPQVPRELLEKAYVRNLLDIPGLKAAFKAYVMASSEIE